MKHLWHQQQPRLLYRPCVFKRISNSQNCYQDTWKEANCKMRLWEKNDQRCIFSEFLLYIDTNGAHSKWPSEWQELHQKDLFNGSVTTQNAIVFHNFLSRTPQGGLSSFCPPQMKVLFSHIEATQAFACTLIFCIINWSSLKQGFKSWQVLIEQKRMDSSMSR